MTCQERVNSGQRTHYKHHKVFYEIYFLEFKAMQTDTGPLGGGGRRGGLIGINPQRRMEGPRHHVGTERPERDSAQKQFDAVLDAIRGRKFARKPERHD